MDRHSDGGVDLKVVSYEDFMATEKKKYGRKALWDMLDGLNPCGCCANGNLEIKIVQSKDRAGYVVECTDCGIRTGLAADPRIAKSLWSDAFRYDKDVYKRLSILEEKNKKLEDYIKDLNKRFLDIRSRAYFAKLSDADAEELVRRGLAGLAAGDSVG